MRRSGAAPAWGKAFAGGLLRWFGRHGRNLPWRRTRDPYRILVSEIKCGAEMKVLAVITEPHVVDRILSHLKASAKSARPPPPPLGAQQSVPAP